MRRVRQLFVAAAAVICLVAVASGSAHGQSAPNCPWMQRSKAPEQRANELIRAMTLDQKVNQVTYSDPPWFSYYGTAGHIDGTPSLCIPAIVMSDAGSGVAGGQQGTTTFPSGVAQAAMFNPGLERRFGAALGDEAWNKGINVMLGPGLNIARIALNGRNFEYMGEDPFLTGRIGAAAVTGIQSQPVLAEPKHYAANNQEADRMEVDERIDERTMREIYLPGFEAAVKDGHAGSVMCAYNKVNTRWACENKELLDGYLRRDWGFNGFVTSDWGATHTTVDSALAGMDVEMFVGGQRYYGDALKQAVQSGKVPMARLDGMVRHVFVPMFRFGLFDKPPVAQPQAYTGQAITPEHRALARQMAQEATVLLKNDGNLLPLDRGSGRTIGVLGYAANPAGASSTSGGGGSSKGSGAPSPVSPLEGIQAEAAAHGDRVIYADGSQTADATAVAAASDVVVAFAADSESEGADRPDLGLRPGACPFPVCVGVPFDQQAMIDAAAAANPNTVVVLASGAPVEMPWLGRVRAVLDQWYAGTENGNAIAQILYGKANPSGKLPQTFPKTVADMPTRTKEQYPGVNKKAVYSEGLKVGYRWFDSQRIAPLFPFGFGLSYTTFRYSGLKVARRGAGARVRFTIANTGRRDGAETGQVYVGFPPSDGEPPRQLKGFDKVFLKAGESKIVRIDLDRRAFSHWSTARRGWRRTAGCYTISVGGSSRELPLHGRVAIAGGSCGGCLARRAPIGPRNVGRVRIGLTRRQLLRRVPAPRRRTRRSWRWCVKGGRGTVSAAFNRRGRVAVVITTAPRHGNRRIHPGTRVSRLRSAYRRRRVIGRGLMRANPRSPRFFGIRKGRVRYIGVASRGTLRSGPLLRSYLRQAGAH